jgi:hypothetical protein
MVITTLVVRKNANLLIENWQKIAENSYYNIGCQEQRQFSMRKLAKIAENGYHNIGCQEQRQFSMRK